MRIIRGICTKNPPSIPMVVIRPVTLARLCSSNKVVATLTQPIKPNAPPIPMINRSSAMNSGLVAKAIKNVVVAHMKVMRGIILRGDTLSMIKPAGSINKRLP